MHSYQIHDFELGVITVGLPGKQIALSGNGTGSFIADNDLLRVVLKRIVTAEEKFPADFDRLLVLRSIVDSDPLFNLHDSPIPVSVTELDEYYLIA